MKITLVGYMGCGKSTIGQELATQFGFPFFDLDVEIEKKYGKTISELFSQLGEIKFRKIEKEALEAIFDRSNDFVLAVGGGTPAYYQNMQALLENSLPIYLRLNPVELSQRLAQEKQKRPLIAHLNDEDLVEFIAKHLFERRQFYEQAPIIVDVKSKSVKELVEEIKNLLPLP